MAVFPLLVLPFLIGTCVEDQDTAQLYYARTAEHRAAEKTPLRPSGIAGGVVRNSLDEPVAGATVIVMRVRQHGGRTKFDHLAKGTTDESGRFAIPAKTRPKDDIGLEVHAPGYMMWRRWAGGTVEEEPVVLNRTIDDAYFADLERESDPTRRMLLVLDFVGRRAWNSYDSNERIEQYYSHLGALHDELLAIAESKSFAAVDDEHETSPAQRAKNLLIFWSDARDESRIRQWAKEKPFEHFRLDVEAAGGSADEAMRAYAKVHFEGEPKTFNYFTAVSYSPDCKRAYAVFVVRYAHWAYWQRVVLLEDGSRWKVGLTGEGGHWHELSPDGPAHVYPDLL
ncbi:MAG TPA: carboxypeptidase-like regulatory domain-containing protein [Thermoanaerobaculia bacterium]|nr:carboxypeptidase-like regulatory domain-containing protein [Thermoanaerobaculia bacterium]